jgi:hypothetical protein
MGMAVMVGMATEEMVAGYLVAAASVTGCLVIAASGNRWVVAMLHVAIPVMEADAAATACTVAMDRADAVWVAVAIPAIVGSERLAVGHVTDVSAAVVGNRQAAIQELRRLAARQLPPRAAG